jgi:3-isopropylmalate/(R)-2-methylmalate dehydratase large subunit
VRKLPNGQTQLFIGTHLIHEVTSPQAFGMLRDLGLKVKYPQRTFATVDHIVPTNELKEPYSDPIAQEMIEALRKNTKDYGIRFFDTTTGTQGIVHMVGPEQGITQPGTTIACGDSHTATHGLATQTLALSPLKVRRIEVNGKLAPGVYAKDVILHIIRVLGVNGGIGYAYEYAGTTFDGFSLEERMTVCNMSIEGGARCGYVNPDQKTFDYIKGKPYAPKAADWDAAVARWASFASDAGCQYDDVKVFQAEDIRPTVTWGITPGQAAHMKLAPNTPIKGTKVDVCFLGSCTNGRISDLREVAKYLKGRKVSPSVKAIVVPGSQLTAIQAVHEGLDKIYIEAGFEWRGAGCSMCLAMNPDKLVGDQLCASSSNRNFKGRQGSQTGRTVLMSPLMVAAAAITGHVADAREVFKV